MSILTEICQKKAEHVASKRKEVPQVLLEEMIKAAEKPRGFINALKKSPAPAIIAEIKKASPSRGIIRADFDPAKIAKIYEENGAACLSVLTDEPYFQGRDEYIAEVKKVSSLPVLRKDFMIDPYQIYESRALGADCILLIMAALNHDDALRMSEIARDLDMDVLVEVHDEPELRAAIELAPAMIGVNNRNLKTLEVDLQTSHALSKMIPAGVLKVAESGLSARDDIRALQASGFDAFLIGESLMRENDIGAALRKLRE
ncbi:MAG: indole-3-glycerol phosphate synthase TrpC [Alphaproteobacteria bacterium]